MSLVTVADCQQLAFGSLFLVRIVGLSLCVECVLSPVSLSARGCVARAYTHTHKHTQTHTQTHTHRLDYTQTHTHTHTHTHVSSLSLSLSLSRARALSLSLSLSLSPHTHTNTHTHYVCRSFLRLTRRARRRRSGCALRT